MRYFSSTIVPYFATGYWLAGFKRRLVISQVFTSPPPISCFRFIVLVIPPSPHTPHHTTITIHCHRHHHPHPQPPLLKKKRMEVLWLRWVIISNRQQYFTSYFVFYSCLFPCLLCTAFSIILCHFMIIFNCVVRRILYGKIFGGNVSTIVFIYFIYSSFPSSSSNTYQY